jgi:hypothetical protein
MYVPANGRSLQVQELTNEAAPTEEAANVLQPQEGEEAMKIDDANAASTTTDDDAQHPDPMANLSEKRKALFEPLEPINGKRSSSDMLLPPPDFEPASYPKGWLVGKKRKLVNVDVVESMRRIAIQEMNRKVHYLAIIIYHHIVAGYRAGYMQYCLHFVVMPSMIIA